MIKLTIFSAINLGGKNANCKRIVLLLANFEKRNEDQLIDLVPPSKKRIAF